MRTGTSCLQRRILFYFKKPPFCPSISFLLHCKSYLLARQDIFNCTVPLTGHNNTFIWKIHSFHYPCQYLSLFHRSPPFPDTPLKAACKLPLSYQTLTCSTGSLFSNADTLRRTAYCNKNGMYTCAHPTFLNI